jgi:putative ABC transport system permease protein
LTVAWWVDVLVGAGALAVVALAALLPALRAGRLRTVEVLAIGRAPRGGRGQWAHRLAARLPLPRAVTYGLAGPFARPVRTAAMLAAVVFGTAAATFAVGLTASANAIGDSRRVDAGYAVQVDPMRLPRAGGAGVPGGPGAGLPVPLSAAEDAQLVTAIEAQPGTRTYYGTAGTQLGVSGVAGPVQARLYFGDSLAGGYRMLAGHWLTGPGQVVAPQHFLTSTGHRVGDRLTLTEQGVSVPATIVGESFNAGDGGTELSVAEPEFSSGPGAPAVWSYQVAVRPGVALGDYLGGLNAALRPLGVSAVPTPSETPHLVLILDGMTAVLTLMLVCVAGLGVLNSVVLDTRERVRDLGVCKAVGMTPGQLLALVLTSVLATGVLGGLLGVPGGIALHRVIMPMVGRGMDSALPASVTDVYGWGSLVLLVAGGAAIAVLGALAPAGWAAKVRTATALRTE